MANLEQLKFAKSHEWVADNGDGTFSIGLTDYAQQELGDLVFVNLPMAVGDDGDGRRSLWRCGIGKSSVRRIQSGQR